MEQTVKEIEVTLHVEADQLWQVGQKNSNAIPYSWITDNNSGSNPLHPTEFESSVNQNENVTWEGKAEGAGSDEYKVIIDEIVHDRGAEIFGSDDPIKGQDGKVTAKVQSTSPVGSLDTYTINFRIRKGNTLMGPFRIDPKLKVDPT